MAIDGKTVRRSHHKKTGNAAIHMVSAFGRFGSRTYRDPRHAVIHDVGWLQQRHNRPGPRGVVIVESTREIVDKIKKETRFYIASLILLANLLGPMVRDHWAENSLHWVLDMIFRDDECRAQTDRAPTNFTTIKHMALTLIRGAKGKQSLRASREATA